MVYATEGLGYAKRAYQEKLAAEAKQTNHLVAMRAINAMHNAPVREVEIKAGHLIGMRIESWESAPQTCDEYAPDGSFRCTEIAQWKFAGERDSWGIEWHYVCEKHMIEAEKAEVEARNTWLCDKCQHKHGDKVDDWHSPLQMRRWYDSEIPGYRTMCSRCYVHMVDQEQREWEESGLATQPDWDWADEDECLHNGVFANGDGKAKFCPHCSHWIPEREL